MKIKRFNIIDFIKYHIKNYGDLTIFNSDIEDYYLTIGQDKYVYDYQLHKVVNQVYDVARNIKKYEKLFNSNELEHLKNINRLYFYIVS